MFQLTISLAVLVIGVSALSPEQFPIDDNEESFHFFRNWAVEHGKTYNSMQEFQTRYNIFLSNMKTAAELNQQRDGDESAHFGPTKFADLTEEEFHNTILSPMEVNQGGNPRHPRSVVNPPRQESAGTQEPTPSSFDWRNKTDYIVTPVRDQGNTNTGWAFAGCAHLESVYAIKYKKRSEILSTQAMIDCAFFNCGIKGGNMDNMMDFVDSQRGMMAEKDYRFCVGDLSCRPCAPKGYMPQVCGNWSISPCDWKQSCLNKYDRTKLLWEFQSSAAFVDMNLDEEDIKKDIYRMAPMTARIDATDMRLYKGGVLKPNKCRALYTNHIVLVTGYGETQDGSKFWSIKNSWGTKWGEEGYLRLQRGVKACGINHWLMKVILDD